MIMTGNVANGQSSSNSSWPDFGIYKALGIQENGNDGEPPQWLVCGRVETIHGVIGTEARAAVVEDLAVEGADREAGHHREGEKAQQ